MWNTRWLKEASSVHSLTHLVCGKSATLACDCGYLQGFAAGLFKKTAVGPGWLAI